VLFDRLGIDTEDVLLAAGSKWNFLGFRPGLVGGHCIGVDPYYLTHKAQAVGYHPEIILAGRRINDSMGGYVASQLVKRMTKDGIPVQGARVLVLGLTFKENTPDLRNSRVVDIIRELEDYDITVDVLDPWADPQEAQEQLRGRPRRHTGAGGVCRRRARRRAPSVRRDGCRAHPCLRHARRPRALRPQVPPGQDRLGPAVVSDRIYLSSPDVTEAEEQALVRAIRSGWVAPSGPRSTPSRPSWPRTAAASTASHCRRARPRSTSGC
jgi:hypothetical protein